MELSQSVSLEFESLECSSFVTQWKSWLFCTMETSPYWEDGWDSMPRELAAQTE